MTVKFTHKAKTVLQSRVVAEVRIQLYNIEMPYFFLLKLFWALKPTEKALKDPKFHFKVWRSIGDSVRCEYICVYMRACISERW